MDIPPAGDNFARRRLCPDGSCTGIIGPDGRCTECGRYVGPLAEKEPPSRDVQQASEGQTPSDHRDGPAPGNSLSENTDDSARLSDQESGAKEKDDFSKRRLCPDGSCTGIIGPDGRCTECGMKVED